MELVHFFTQPFHVILLERCLLIFSGLSAGVKPGYRITNGMRMLGSCIVRLSTMPCSPINSPLSDVHDGMLSSEKAIVFLLSRQSPTDVLPISGIGILQKVMITQVGT